MGSHLDKWRVKVLALEEPCGRQVSRNDPSRGSLETELVMSRLIFVAVLLSFSLFLVSCTTPGGREVGDVYDDTVIATKVKGRLTEIMGTKVIGIDVDVYQGEVTLQGRVRSPNMESRVIAVTARVPGVRKVINLLKIIP